MNINIKKKYYYYLYLRNVPQVLFLPATERSAAGYCFFYVFFIAIADNVFVCIDIKNAMVIFSTYFNTTWTIT